MIVKKDGRREVFNRNKVRQGLQKACEKREISINVIEETIDNLERDLRETGEKEIPAKIIGEKLMTILHKLDDIDSKEIGERVINSLKEWDEVAYVRFASVYREFKDVNDFMEELKTVLNNR